MYQSKNISNGNLPGGIQGDIGDSSHLPVEADVSVINRHVERSPQGSKVWALRRFLSIDGLDRDPLSKKRMELSQNGLVGTHGSSEILLYLTRMTWKPQTRFPWQRLPEQSIPANPSPSPTGGYRIACSREGSTSPAFRPRSPWPPEHGPSRS